MARCRVLSQQKLSATSGGVPWDYTTLERFGGALAWRGAFTRSLFAEAHGFARNEDLIPYLDALEQVRLDA